MNLALTTMTVMIMMDEARTESSGPINLLIISSGTESARPERMVTVSTPFSALTPPPMMATIKSGVMVFRINSWAEINVPS